MTDADAELLELHALAAEHARRATTAAAGANALEQLGDVFPWRDRGAVRRAVKRLRDAATRENLDALDLYEQVVAGWRALCGEFYDHYRDQTPAKLARDLHERATAAVGGET